jgi:hypothetical protein
VTKDYMLTIMWDKVMRLEKAVAELRGNPEDNDRDVYFVEDIARLLEVKPETIRKNYIAKGLIETGHKIGKRLTISRNEYLRIHNSYSKYGEIIHGIS